MQTMLEATFLSSNFMFQIKLQSPLDGVFAPRRLYVEEGAFKVKQACPSRPICETRGGRQTPRFLSLDPLRNS